jgi:transposase
VQLALHPTLTRLWCRKGYRGQRKVEAPGSNARIYGFGLLDYRDGFFDGQLAQKRSAPPFCAQLERAIARSVARGRIAIVIADNLGAHTPRRSLLVRKLLNEQQEHLRLVYTPSYDPDCNGIEQLWQVTRRTVTHNHQRTTIEEIAEDARAHFAYLSEHPQQVLRHIGSPLAERQGSAGGLPLAA